MKTLIVEDDENIAELLQLYLEKDGFRITIAGDGRAALDAVESFTPDIILLDIMLPRLDGSQVLKRLREQGDNTPVIMLTAKDSSFDKIINLEGGADDYITKPFLPSEVVARIHAVLRRTSDGAEVSSPRVLTFDKLTVNMESFALTLDGTNTEIPPKEMELLFHLASSPNRVFTRTQLLDEVWGFDYFGDSRTVDVHIKRLREKLNGISDKWQLKTVWGVGYKFELLED